MSPLRERIPGTYPIYVLTLHSILPDIVCILSIRILYIVATQGVYKNSLGMLNCPQSIQQGEDMYINYNTQEVVRTITVDVVESFNLDIKVPVWEVRLIVERNFVESGEYGLAGFNKITAIKEVRTSHLGIPYLSVGLREAKEMVEAVYNEGIEAGNYHATVPKTLKPYEAEGDSDNHNYNATADTLPF